MTYNHFYERNRWISWKEAISLPTNNTGAISISNQYFHSAV